MSIHATLTIESKGTYYTIFVEDGSNIFSILDEKYSTAKHISRLMNNGDVTDLKGNLLKSQIGSGPVNSKSITASVKESMREGFHIHYFFDGEEWELFEMEDQLPNARFPNKNRIEKIKKFLGER